MDLEGPRGDAIDFIGQTQHGCPDAEQHGCLVTTEIELHKLRDLNNPLHSKQFCPASHEMDAEPRLCEITG